MKHFLKGEILTVVTVLGLVAFSAVAFISSIYLSSQNRITTNSKAAEISCATAPQVYGFCTKICNDANCSTSQPSGINAGDCRQRSDNNNYYYCGADQWWHGPCAANCQGTGSNSPNLPVVATTSPNQPAPPVGSCGGVKTGYGNCSAISPTGTCVYRSYSDADPHYFNQFIYCCPTDGFWYAKDSNSQDAAKGWQNQPECVQAGGSVAPTPVGASGTTIIAPQKSVTSVVKEPDTKCPPDPSTCGEVGIEDECRTSGLTNRINCNSKYYCCPNTISPLPSTSLSPSISQSQPPISNKTCINTTFPEIGNTLQCDYIYGGDSLSCFVAETSLYGHKYPRAKCSSSSPNCSFDCKKADVTFGNCDNLNESCLVLSNREKLKLRLDVNAISNTSTGICSDGTWFFPYRIDYLIKVDGSDQVVTSGARTTMFKGGMFENFYIVGYKDILEKSTVSVTATYIRNAAGILNFNRADDKTYPISKTKSMLDVINDNIYVNDISGRYLNTSIKTEITCK